ncbi:UDP-N-acetylmuramoyl-L-alanyl-D-glutamate--2,6-diaminopimelate ligase [Candidatus Liberibacter americanus]|uniref:UDP-N-acetylmuramoyl-L-alanyl-D-glutamate--2,6-diaminopimelate ligase n=1 Tax=Candidatus Liberibacter americanus str. Sao Paulo TaxID=1261131 RepID=U6B7I9_9HYPH|nr:UDP-N-acetylmuramoyl-L-alanyl-D-glutamate--2,6-diaminopimelate ligase [Candidatus Liberibacter americanus]AHA27831.1 UDP-N-acetylmuramyl tripeptide synthase [Candidatus Liberibacter americanus str. Sao Paulo]EMS35998.1 UDP-N-acetylmuramoylalanyl-D-glutamate--2,6-diaminopimelate ligase [Candidatus Liberibacter americanus PW_SP]
MKLKDLICSDFPELTQQLLSFSADCLERDICHISSDSRAIKKGWMFVAIAGNKLNGHDFISQALQLGATAVVIDSCNLYCYPDNLKFDVPIIVVDNTRRFLAIISTRLYGAHPEKIFAVTGTAGKTSVAFFVRQIFQYLGLSASQIGTEGLIPFLQHNESRLTTPSPVYLSRLLPLLVSKGVTHLSIEASSHGLDQHRLDGIKFFAGAFTNLGRDHLDYHKTIDAYFDAKMLLFERLLPKGAPAVIFADNEFSEKVIMRAKTAGCHVLSVGNNGQFIRIKQLISINGKQRVKFSIDGKNYDIIFPVHGEFQVYNAFVAAGLCLSTGINVDDVIKSLEQLSLVPGRFEYIGDNSRGGKIYVDYAHTPDSLKTMLKSIRNIFSGKIILVFGCGGDRDVGKRRIMGQIALKMSDVAIVTDDNPRTEDPVSIRSDIIDGCSGFIEEGSRQDAIRMAISMLNADDVLVVAGKGQEKVQIIKDGEKMLSVDCEIIREILLGSL